jgi:SAM-dependent methyltransferase
LSRLTSFLNSLRRRPHVKRIIASIPEKDLETLRAEYPDAGWFKYLDMQTYVPIAVRHCQQLNLMDVPPKQILDIGCGTGLFLYCARHFGHRGIGIDIENDLLRDVARLLNVDRRIESVKAFEPLSVEGAFDLVTAMGTQFDLPNLNIGEGRWGCVEWRYFLSDVERRLLPTGRVFLRINRGREARAEGRNYYDEQVHRALFHGRLGGISYLFDRGGLRRAIDNLESVGSTPVRADTR